MTNTEAIILGIVQGLTEFLPVSSSGHLVLTQKLMNVDDPGVTFELLKQSAMHDFGVVLLFGRFFYLLPQCCWFELPPTAGQQCCFWSG